MVLRIEDGQSDDDDNDGYDDNDDDDDDDAGDLYRNELQGPLLRAEHARAHRAARLQQGISYFYKL